VVQREFVQAVVASRVGEASLQLWGAEMKPRLLDLFCGAGGAAMGYHRAGFDVVGVDVIPQPNYPFTFVQGDALEVLRSFATAGPIPTFDAIHASPPCQADSVTASLHTARYPRLIPPVRAFLLSVGLPFVIENVVGAALVNHIRLCGSAFGLGVRRHRLFEIQPMPIGVPPCAHHLQPDPIDVTGTGARRVGVRADGKGGNSRKPRNLTEAREAMGIDWMSRAELSEAIPPAYTEWIGERLLEHLRSEAA
jgi:DNA (cytosine-5)-methyltransferase 1